MLFNAQNVLDPHSALQHISGLLTQPHTGSSFSRRSLIQYDNEHHLYTMHGWSRTALSPQRAGCCGHTVTKLDLQVEAAFSFSAQEEAREQLAWNNHHYREASLPIYASWIIPSSHRLFVRHRLDFFEGGRAGQVGRVIGLKMVLWKIWLERRFKLRSGRVTTKRFVLSYSNKPTEALVN